MMSGTCLPGIRPGTIPAIIRGTTAIGITTRGIVRRGRGLLAGIMIPGIIVTIIMAGDGVAITAIIARITLAAATITVMAVPATIVRLRELRVMAVSSIPAVSQAATVLEARR
jgi:hypothetical protein